MLVANYKYSWGLLLAILLLLTVCYRQWTILSDEKSDASQYNSFSCSNVKNNTHFVGCLICNMKDNNQNSVFFSDILKDIGALEVPLKRKSFRPVAQPSRNSTSNEQVHGSPINSVQEIFDGIYSKNVWTPAGGGSGVGSDEGFAVSASHILQLGIAMTSDINST